MIMELQVLAAQLDHSIVFFTDLASCVIGSAIGSSVDLRRSTGPIYLDVFIFQLSS